MGVLARSIRSFLAATNIEQKIKVDRLLKEFNAESSQEKIFNQKTLNSFVGKQPFFNY